MSKIDHLLSLADNLSLRSDKLVTSICESNNLISLILELNGSIAAADSQIDTMTEVINKNNICLNEFEKLYEKSFFLESNLLYNQSYTNETSLDNLSKEYLHLLSSFGHHNVCHLVEKDVLPPPENRALKNMLSISNLELKPIRCRTTKVAKQKSRYRLSAAYTLNPLSETSARDFLKSSHETVSTLMEEYESPDSLVTSLAEDDTPKFARTQSVRSHRTTTVNVSEAVHSDAKTTESAATASDLANLDKKSPQHEHNLFIFRAMSPVNLSSVNLDDLEEYDFSLSDSSPTPSDDLDNFHKYLRQSRVDLRTAFPAPLYKSTSHESVFSTVQIPTQKPQPLKFHNPALMLTSHAKEAVNQPTAETIYSSSIPSHTSLSVPPVVSNFKEHSRKLLNDLLRLELPESPTKAKPITPRRKSNFTLFNLLNSPMGSPSGFSNIKEEPTTNSNSRRGSIDLVSKSLTSGLMSLVGSTWPVEPSPSLPTPLHCPPPQLKKLRKGIRDPIEFHNEVHHKRLPVHDRKPNNGSHSSITIGPGKQKVINHGEASIFKRPTVRRMSQQLLHEALRESLLK